MEERPPDVTPEVAAKKKMLRIGWCTVGLGTGGAVVAAIIGGANSGGMSPLATGATALHRFGAFIMLMGLGVVLAAYRLEYLQTRWRRRMQSQSTESSQAFLKWFRRISIGVPATLAIIVLPWILLAVINDVVAGVLILWMSLLMPIVLATILVYGRGYWRTFSIGALFPAGFFFIGMGIAVFLKFIQRPSLPAFWSFFRDIGEATLLAGFSWTLIVLSGLLAMGVRLLIEGLRRRAATAPSVENAESKEP